MERKLNRTSANQTSRSDTHSALSQPSTSQSQTQTSSQPQWSSPPSGSSSSLKGRPSLKSTPKLRRTGAYYPSSQFTVHPKNKKK